LRFDYWRERPLVLLLSGVLLGGLGFLNAWDLPTFGFLLALLVLLRNLVGRLQASAVADTVGFVVPLAALAVLLYAPFYLTFGSQADGLAAVSDEATKPLHSALFWAPLIAVCLPLPLARLAADVDSWTGQRVLYALCVPLTLLVLWALLLALNGESVIDAISERGVNWLTTGFFAAALVICLLALWRTLDAPEEDANALTPVLGAMTLAVLLILGTELFYVQDLFASRLNSVFKLYYQAWLLLGVTGGFSLVWLVTRWLPASPALHLPRQAVAGLIAVCLAAAFLYPVGATLSRTEGLGRDGRTLDGTQFRENDDLHEYLAIDWLRQRAQPHERIIEAPGDSYSSDSQISAASGVPTILGWSGHERQWGRDPDLLAERRADIDKVYSTSSLDEAVGILRKYGVTYVYVGDGYAETYSVPAIDKFEMGLQPVFRSGDVAIYRLPLEAPAAQ
jgi:YYY domain-containing protein